MTPKWQDILNLNLYIKKVDWYSEKTWTRNGQRPCPDVKDYWYNKTLFYKLLIHSCRWKYGMKRKKEMKRCRWVALTFQNIHGRIYTTKHESSKYAKKKTGTDGAIRELQWIVKDTKPWLPPCQRWVFREARRIMYQTTHLVATEDHTFHHLRFSICLASSLAIDAKFSAPLCNSAVRSSSLCYE